MPSKNTCHLIRRSTGLAALAATLLAAGLAAQAQTPSPSQLLDGPERVAVPQALGAGVALAGDSAGSTPPPGAEGVMLLVGEVAVEGGSPQLQPEIEAIIGPLQGNRVSIAAVYAAADAIERAYARHGLFLTQVVIPPQNVAHGGILRLRVIEGFIESIDTGELADPVRGRVAAIVADIVDMRGLTLPAFERHLLLAGDTAGLTLQSSLMPGTRPGAVRLVLKGQYRPVTGEVRIDNSLPSSLGTISATTGIGLHSMLGLGESLHLSLSGTPTEGFLADDSARRLAIAGITVPIGHDGLILGLEGSYSDTNPVSQAGVLDTQSTFKRLSLSGSYPLIRSRATNLTVRGALDIIEEDQTAPLFDAYLYDDAVRPIRVGLDWSHVFDLTDTRVAAGVQFSQGVDWLDSRGAGDATPDRPLSRAGADDVYSILALNGALVQPLGGAVTFRLDARGQVALDGPLVNSERFTLGGAQALSALNSGALAGDNGWMVRAELQYGPAELPGLPGSMSVQPYVFVSGGQVFNIEPSVLEPGSLGAVNVGAGLRSHWRTPTPSLPLATSVGLEVAHGFSREASAEGWRFNGNVAVRF